LSRLTDVPRERLPKEQRRFYDAVKSIRGRPVSGPFIVLMNSSPDLAARFAHLGHYFHSRGQADESPLPVRARAFVSLVGSRALDATYEFAAWIDTMREAGIRLETIDAIREGKNPPLDAEEALIAKICGALVSGDHRIDAATFDAALARFGQQQLVDLVSTLGYFAMIALPLNAFEIAMTPKQIALRKPFTPLTVNGSPWKLGSETARALPPIGGGNTASPRVPLLAGHDDVAPEHQHFLDRVVRSRGWVSPAFAVLMHSADAAERIAHVGSHLLYEAALPPAVRALVLLAGAREFDCAYTWRAAIDAAVAADIDSTVIHAIEHGKSPAGIDPAAQAVLDFCRQLMRGNHHVDDAIYEAMTRHHGVPVAVLSAAMLGYVVMMSMIANAFNLATDGTAAGPLL